MWGIKGLLPSFHNGQWERGWFCRVELAGFYRSRWHWSCSGPRFQVLSTWMGGYISQTFSSQQLWPGQMLRKAQHRLIFGAHVRTLISLRLFYSCATSGLQLLGCFELQVVNRLVRLLTPSILDLFTISAWKRSLCLWFDTNSCDGAFRNHCK